MKKKKKMKLFKVSGKKLTATQKHTSFKEVMKGIEANLKSYHKLKKKELKKGR